MRDFESEENLKRIGREKRREQLRRERRRRRRRRRLLLLCCFFLCAAALLAAGLRLLNKGKEEETKEQAQTEAQETEEADALPIEETPEEPAETDDSPEEETEPEEEDSPEEEEETAELLFAAGYTADTTDATAGIDDETVPSVYAVLIDLDDMTVTAQKRMNERISPASMTKILTVLVAAEHVTDLDDTFTMTREITDYSYGNDCSAAGFDVDETVTVRDLFYGTILPSGADAAAGLAYYVSGSMEGFVELMNEKLEELGLSDTAHFTNCVGLYDENHYCTVYDMAMMLKAAVENEFCREVLSTHIYTTSATKQHPEGIELSNWFLRRIEDKETNGEVVCAKTGYVAQSGNCAASYLVSGSGKHYICVTANAWSGWRCIYDHVALYQNYTD